MLEYFAMRPVQPNSPRRHRMSAAAAAAVIAAGILAVITHTAAAAEGSAVLPPAGYTESGCAGRTPIVVGSDAAAQSDIYSAVTLAGAIGTECVVLAGPRNGGMPAAQRARLDAASARGWVVGGAAAVPDAKIAGRSLTRVAGEDRWATAQRVGAAARSLAGGGLRDAPPLGAALDAPADVEQPGVHLRGAEPWIASDCDGDTPVVVGSDARAQSDIYSAVTLAGVIGTDCVILAGPRDGRVPASQRARLDASAGGGFVVGGTAAVPAAKTAGRGMTRLSGADRWETAQLVGRRASGDTTAGAPTTAADLTGVTPVLTVHVDGREPTVGDPVRIVAMVTDEHGSALAGAELVFVIDGESRGTALAGSDGQATFTYSAPHGSMNEGGYDSIQVQVVSTDVASRPAGVFWQQPESRRITISVSPDRAHSSAARTITAQALDGTAPMAGRAVELHIDGTMLERAATDSSGNAVFKRRAPLHGPFDLAKVVLADDHDVSSDEKLFSWPLNSRGAHSSNDWHLVWRDEFSGTSLDTAKWEPSNNCPPVYQSCETDRPANVYLADGMLHLRSLREQYVGTNDWKGSGEQFGPLTTYTPGEYQLKEFTAGRVDSSAAFTYGRFEMLGRLPQGHGTFFAYFMTPRKSPYGRGASAGEIDIAEGANIGVPNNNRVAIDAQLPGPGWGVHHVVHMGRPFTNPFTLTNLPVNPAESFHLYAVEWDTASLRFYVDGQRVHTVPRSDWFSHPAGQAKPVDNPHAPFDVPFGIAISNVVGGWATESLPGFEVPDTTVFPTEFVVDYFRVYECRPPQGSSADGPGQGCETP